MSDIDVHHLAAAYTLDALEPARARGVRGPLRVVRRVPCRRVRSSARRMITVAPIRWRRRPPPSLKDRVLADIAVTRQLSPCSHRWCRCRSAAPVGTCSCSRRPSLRSWPSSSGWWRSPDATTRRSATNSPRSSTNPMHGWWTSQNKGDHEGTFKVAWSPSTRRGGADRREPAAAPGGKAYELWLITPDQTMADVRPRPGRQRQGAPRRCTAPADPTGWAITHRAAGRHRRRHRRHHLPHPSADEDLKSARHIVRVVMRRRATRETVADERTPRRTRRVAGRELGPRPDRRRVVAAPRHLRLGGPGAADERLRQGRVAQRRDRHRGSASSPSGAVPGARRPGHAARRADHRGARHARSRSSATCCRSSPASRRGASCSASPAPGSDLAGLGARAVKDGEEWVVNGQKVWTSGGQIADMGMLIARTDPDVPKHQGITWFAFDMHQGERGRRAPAAGDDRPGAVQRGVPQRRPCRRRRDHRRHEQRLGRGQHDADVRARRPRRRWSRRGRARPTPARSPATCPSGSATSSGRRPAGRRRWRRCDGGRPAEAAHRDWPRQNGMIHDPSFRQDLMKLHTLHEVGRMLTLAGQGGEGGRPRHRRGAEHRQAVDERDHAHRAATSACASSGANGTLHAYDAGRSARPRTRPPV